jgi:hypothetical protein
MCGLFNDVRTSYLLESQLSGEIEQSVFASMRI